MSLSGSFADRSHLEHIKKSLWTGRLYGKASVMVGAGFSMNAESRKSDAKPFPNWSQLAARIYDELYPAEPEEDSNRERTKSIAIAGLGAMRLASEYEMSFDRGKLDSLLLQAIPYESYGPGELHRLLLSLPWSDVFTTNYDTLLEDARIDVTGKRYDLVLTARDIPRGMKPRIVKLHGSFPSNRPFIVTEEDYRKYPARSAPFVNLVQQSLMENTFCLIGFSGDDPNFLHWIGWVRDNLGQHTPKLYLCGMLNLSGSARSLLESRNVIPVDLSSLFPGDQWPDRVQRHAEAMKWFLTELKKGEPPYVMNWPRAPQSPGVKKHIPKGNKTKTERDTKGAFDPTGPRGKASSDHLVRLLELWKQQRVSYPGWIVCPRQNRGVLWLLTKYWIGPIADSLENLKPPNDLLVLRELNWRLEKALAPLPGIEHTVGTIVKSFNPFPRLADIQGSSASPENTRYDATDWDEIGEAWLELIFGIVRKAREDFDEETFRHWMNILKQIVPRKKDWQPRYWYEECLFHLFRLDWNGVIDALNEGPADHDQPFWQVKRASIMAEVGQAEQAGRIVEDALKIIKSSVDPDKDDYRVLSQEGWATILSSVLITNRTRDPSEGTDQHRGRWAELSSFRCNPWSEIEIMGSKLDQALPVPPAEKEERLRNGHRRPVYTITTESKWELRLPGFAFLRQFEEGGQPVSSGTFNIAGDTTVRAIQWIFSLSPLMALSFLVRNGNTKSGEDWFDRIRAASLTQDQVDKLASILTSCLQRGLAILGDSTGRRSDAGHALAVRVAVTVPDLLAILCFRFSSADRNRLFELVVQAYTHPFFGRGIRPEGSFKGLVESLISSMTSQEIVDRMHDLMSLPIPQAGGFEVSYPSEWVEPFNSLRPRYADLSEANRDPSLWQQPILELLKILENATPLVRTSALIRLNTLNAMEALTDKQRNTLKTALWSRTDSLTGLPADIAFHPHSLLLQLGAEENDAKGKFRGWILKLDFPRILVQEDKSTGMSVSGKSIHENRIIDEIIYATKVLLPLNEKINEMRMDWTPGEATDLLKKAAEWWHVNKDDLQKDICHDVLFMQDQFRGELGKIVPLFAHVVLPRLEEAGEESKGLALTVLAEMEEKEFSISLAQPLTLFVDPDRLVLVTKKLRHGLASSNEKAVSDTIEGTFLWLLHGLQGSIPKLPEDLMNELINIVVSRKQPGLLRALDKLETIARRVPEELSREQLLSLCVGLEYLKGETELPTDLEGYGRRVPHPTVPLEQRPDYRELAAGLAQAIHVYLSKREEEVPQVLLEWREICLADLFPEVRRSWPV